MPQDQSQQAQNIPPLGVTQARPAEKVLLITTWSETHHKESQAPTQLEHHCLPDLTARSTSLLPPRHRVSDAPMRKPWRQGYNIVPNSVPNSFKRTISPSYLYKLFVTLDSFLQNSNISWTWLLINSFPGGATVKNLPIIQEIQKTRVWPLSQKDLPEEETATHSSILAWTISWTEGTGGLQFMGSQRVRHARMHAPP